MNEKHFFAVDLGATSGRTILGTYTCPGLQTEEINRFPNHLIQCNGHFYWDIYELYRNIVEGLSIVGQRKDIHLTSIGIDTWGCDFVCVDKDGGFLRMPYAYRDPHTQGAAKQYFQEFDPNATYSKTGIQIMDFNTLFQFYTLNKNHDEAFSHANKLLFMPDALSYLLTGQMVTEYTIATTAQIVNAEQRKLDEEILHTVGLTSNDFGRFVYPGETIGTLTEALQKQTRLGAIPVVAVAGHDTGSAVAAVPGSSEHFAYLSSGTWSLMGIENDKPIINERSKALNYTNEGGINDTIRILKNICGMWLLERCREKWTDTDYATLIQEAKSATPFRSFINPDDTSFACPDDMEQAIKDFCRRTNQPIPEQRGALVRCIFESLALRYRQVMEQLDQLSGHPSGVLHIIGGGSRNDLLNQWTANSINKSVIAGPAEATAIGNIMVQILANDSTSDIASLRKEFQNSMSSQHFEPQEPKVWDDAYEAWQKITH